MMVPKAFFVKSVSSSSVLLFEHLWILKSSFRFRRVVSSRLALLRSYNKQLIYSLLFAMNIYVLLNSFVSLAFQSSPLYSN